MPEPTDLPDNAQRVAQLTAQITESGGRYDVEAGDPRFLGQLSTVASRLLRDNAEQVTEERYAAALRQPVTVQLWQVPADDPHSTALLVRQQGADMLTALIHVDHWNRQVQLRDGAGQLSVTITDEGPQFEFVGSQQQLDQLRQMSDWFAQNRPSSPQAQVRAARTSVTVRVIPNEDGTVQLDATPVDLEVAAAHLAAFFANLDATS